MNSSIDNGILELVRLGRLSAVSCMPKGLSFPENSNLLAKLPVDIGLHLNFTESMVDDEFYLPLLQLIFVCYFHRLPTSLVVSQIHGQLDAFEANFGRPPDFIDGHQHIHQLPVIREALLEVLKQRYSGQRIWIRSTLPAAASSLMSRNQLKAKIISMLGTRKLCALTKDCGLPMNHALLGVYEFSTRNTGYKELFLQWLRNSNDGDLLMCHPANSIQATDKIGLQRKLEFVVLSDTNFPSWLNDNGLIISRQSKFEEL